MPDETVDPRPPTGRQPRLRAFLDDLAGAHAHVVPTGDEVRIDFGAPGAAISMQGGHRMVRLLLTDALAGLDAVEAGR